MSGEENLANSVRDYIIYECLVPLSDEDKKTFGIESPIEELFLIAILVCNRILIHAPVLVHKDSGKGKIGIDTQVKILEYRADFVFRAVSPSGKIKNLVVECDGHNFHERTKEQAARDRSRDRAMQEAGYSVYRFTGSEIHRDAFACARQVFRWAQNVCEGAE